MTKFQYFKTTLKWLLYLMITSNERMRYSEAKEKRMDCVSSENGLFGTEYGFDPSKPPVKRYKSRKEIYDLWREHYKNLENGTSV